MIITKTINTDLLIKGPAQEIYAVQGDRYTRKVTLRLHANKVPWTPAGSVGILIRYQKPDGTGGTYDTLPTGEKAWEQSGNEISFLLAPQMLTVPGRITLQVELSQGGSILATFPMEVVVEKDAAAEVAQSQDYVSWQDRLERRLADTLTQLKESGAFDGATPQLEIGTVFTLPEGSQANAVLRGTATNPILDLYLPQGAKAVVDSTLSHAQEAADAKAVGDALAQKAPGGYGLGAGAITVSTFNYAGGNGFIEGANDAPYHSSWTGVNVAFGADHVHGYQEIVDVLSSPNVKARRYKVNGQWGPWEYENPPMLFGVEYRTTQRWNGKAIYTMLIDCGNITAGGCCSLPYTCTRTIRYAATDGIGTLPFIYESMDNPFTCWSTLTHDQHLYIYDTKNDSHPIKCQVWYVKD